MLDMLQSKVKSLKRKLPSDYFDQSRRLLKRSAQTPEDMTILADISQAMRLDYDVRRAMLLKRLDVTIQSFLWSDKVVGQEDDLLNAIDPLIEQLKEARPAINPKKIFEATPSLREEQEIRVTEASLSSSVKGVIIGSVPDRGGRANEVSTDHFGISFFHLLTEPSISILQMRPSMKDIMPGWSSRNNKKDSRMVFKGSKGGNNNKNSSKYKNGKNRHRSKSPRQGNSRHRSKSPHQKQGNNNSKNHQKNKAQNKKRGKSPGSNKGNNYNKKRGGGNSSFFRKS